MAKSTALANINEELRKEAAEMGKRLNAPQGKFIKLSKDKHFITPDGTKQKGPLTGVVLDFVSRNLYYAGKYKEGSPQPPDCFAIGKVIEDLRPSDNAPDKQHDNCAGCMQNKFAKDGGGKPCKNTRYLALMPPKAKADDPILVMSVSPTGLKSWDKYVRDVQQEYGCPPIGVITEVTFDETVDYQSLKFRALGRNPNLETHYGRRGDALSILEAEPVFQAKEGGKGGKSRTLR